MRVVIVAGCGWPWPLVLGTEKEHAARNSRGAAAPMLLPCKQISRNSAPAGNRACLRGSGSVCLTIACCGTRRGRPTGTSGQYMHTDTVCVLSPVLQTTQLMDAWLKHKLAENSKMFGHRVGAIPTNVIDANRRYLV